MPRWDPDHLEDQERLANLVHLEDLLSREDLEALCDGDDGGGEKNILTASVSNYEKNCF